MAFIDLCPLVCTSSGSAVSFPDPTLKEGKGSGDIGEFSWSCAPSRAPIQIYANCHMIAELAVPRIGSNVTRSFPRVCGWVWERDYRLCCTKYHHICPRQKLLHFGITGDQVDHWNSIPIMEHRLSLIFGASSHTQKPIWKKYAQTLIMFWITLSTQTKSSKPQPQST